MIRVVSLGVPQVAFRIRQSTPAAAIYAYTFKDMKAPNGIEAAQLEPK